MPRSARLDCPHVAHHIFQRVQDPARAFVDDADRAHYLDALRDCAAIHGCAVHAYALWPAGVRLLVTPAERGALSRMMQALGRRHAGYIHARDGSRGRLWNGRFQSCPVGGDRYVLGAYRCIESASPDVRGDSAGAYWSSRAFNACGAPSTLIVPAPAYLQLGRTRDARVRRYLALSTQTVAEAVCDALHMHTAQGRPWGSADFVAAMVRMHGCKTGVRPRGRPRKRGPQPGSFNLSPFFLTGCLLGLYAQLPFT